jgi:hypothetical protein
MTIVLTATATMPVSDTRTAHTIAHRVRRRIERVTA